MNRWICDRPGQWRLTVEGGSLLIASSEYSDWVAVAPGDIALLLDDINSLVRASSGSEAQDAEVTHS